MSFALTASSTAPATPYAYSTNVPVAPARAVAHIAVTRADGETVALCERHRIVLDTDLPALAPTCARCLKRAGLPLAWIAKHDIFQQEH